MNHAVAIAFAAFASALLAGCSTGSGDEAAAGGNAVTRPPKSSTAAGTVFETKMVALPFRLDVTYSAAALAKLREANADLGVSADYYGPPKDPGMAGLEPDLGVWLGGEMRTMDPGERSQTFKGEIDAARVAREVAGDARVRVTAFPVRAQAEVTCAPFDEYLGIAVETGATVHCTLSGE